MEIQHTEIREVRVSYHPTNVQRSTFRLPGEVAEFVRSVLTDNSREHFIAVYLDGSHKPVGYSVVGIGGANFCNVHPREVFQRACISGACSLVIAHNHPSGSLEPSEQDWTMTKQAQKAGKLLGIKVLDHVIVTDEAYCSLATLDRWN